MKIYLTYQKDGYDGKEVEAVFATMEAAQKFVIESHFSRNAFYKGKTQKELMKLAVPLIHEFVVFK